MRDVPSRVTRLALMSLALITLAIAWTSIASAATPQVGSVGPTPAPPFQNWQGNLYAVGIGIDPILCPSQTGPLPNDPGSIICDHYRLTVTGAGPVAVRIDWASADNDFDLRVYSCAAPSNPAVGCDTLVAASVESGTNFEALSFPATANTTYEIRVQPVFLFTPSDYRGCAAFLARATCTSTGGVINATMDPPISISNARVIEGDSGTTQATFAVALGAPTVSPVTVNYVTKDGTATAGTDYVPTTGTVVFQPGQTSATISIPVTGDMTKEPDQVFEVDLALADPAIVIAKIKDGQGFGTIVDDDSRRVVNGNGKVGVLSQGTLSLRVAENLSGKLNYRDAATRFYSTSVSSATFTDLTRSATIGGKGINNGHTVTYTLEVADNGAGALDTYVLTISDGTRVTGPLTSGDIAYTG